MNRAGTVWPDEDWDDSDQTWDPQNFDDEDDFTEHDMDDAIKDALYEDGAW